MSFFSDLFSNDKSKFKRDAKNLTPYLQGLQKDWVPIDSDEIESIALKIIFDRNKRFGFTSYRIGHINTIFHEHVATFGLRKYGDQRGIIVAQTNPYIYTFLVRPKYTEVQINYKRLAFILADGTLKNSSGRKIIGEIDTRDVDHPEVIIGDNNFGILNRATTSVGPQTRAIHMMRPMPEGVQELFFSVVMLYIISNQSELKGLADLV